MPKITKADDLVQLNRQFARLDLLHKQNSDLQQRVENLSSQVKQFDVVHAPQTTNDILFTWTGGTTTLSWPAGSVKNKNNQNVPVSAGTLTGLTASKYYWLAWNPIHKQMIAQLGVDGLLQNSNNIVICQVFTGGGGDTGVAGGGGSSNSGGSDLSGGRYKLFYAPC